MIKNVLILEDNKITSNALKKAIEKLDRGWIRVYTAETYESACLLAMEKKIEVFVLDIILDTKKSGDTSGFRFAQMLRDNRRYTAVPIIFLTTLADISNHALHQFHCFDYLEKPVHPDDAAKVVEKALEFCETEKSQTVGFMRKDGIIYPIKSQDVVYAEVNNHDLSIYFVNKVEVYPNRTLKYFLNEMNNKMFIQCSRSTVVNYNYIANIDVVNRYVSLKKTKKEIEVSLLYMRKLTSEYYHA